MAAPLNWRRHHRRLNAVTISVTISKVFLPYLSFSNKMFEKVHRRLFYYLSEITNPPRSSNSSREGVVHTSSEKKRGLELKEVLCELP
jgi:hypothetical protein